MIVRLRDQYPHISLDFLVIDLVVGVARKIVKRIDGVGDHVVGKVLGKIGPDFCGVDSLRCDESAESRARRIDLNRDIFDIFGHAVYGSFYRLKFDAKNVCMRLY